MMVGCGKVACGALMAAVLAAPLIGVVTSPPQAQGTVTKPVWGPMRTLWKGGSEPDVAVDGRGNTVLVWTGAKGIQAMRKPVGGAWGKPVTLGRGGAPQVGTDSRGDLTVVWSGGAYFRVMAAHRPVGGPWSKPVALSRPSSFDKLIGSFDPHLAVSSGGAVVVTWWYGSMDGEGPWRAEADFRPAGGRWQGPVPIAGTRCGSQDVGIDARGNALAVCSDANQSVLAVRRVVGRGWQRPVRISGSDKIGDGPWVAVNARGDATAIWTRYRSQALRAARRAAGGTWKPPVTVTPFAIDPAVVLDGSGHSTAAWSDGSGRVEAARVALKGGWGQPVTVAPALNGDAMGVAVGANGAGDVLVSWVRQSGNPGQNNVDVRVQAAYRPAGGPWTSPQRLTPRGMHVYGHTPLVYRDGHAILVWSPQGRGIYAKTMHVR